MAFNDLAIHSISNFMPITVNYNEGNVAYSIKPEEVKKNISIIGERGFSAYQIAKVNGFIGTEQEWVASLSDSTSLTAVNELNDMVDLSLIYQNARI